MKQVISPEPLELGIQEFEDTRATAIMEELRKKVAGVLGVTVVGPYVTLRFGDSKRLVQVSMQVTSITDSNILEELDYDLDK